MENLTDAIATLLNTGASQASIRTIEKYGKPFEKDGKPFVVIPDGYKVVDVERMLDRPTRKTGTVATTDTESFIAYLKKHGNPDDCTLYADVDHQASKCNILAIINDHDSFTAYWRDFRATFASKVSVEWARWIGKDRAVMSQSDFAAWLEDNLSDVALVAGMPTGAEILAMALGFEANADKKLRSKINLQSGGVRFEFTDDETKETRTSMQVFERFTLGLPVFEGSQNAYPLEARLKYREKGGLLTFWYELIRSDKVFKSAVSDELQRITDATGFMLIYGSVIE